MEPAHPLKALLQLQLATDSSAALHLPYILDSLTADCLLPSSHLTKWTARINSLLHSKEPGGRWAGLCLACKTSDLSREIMIEFSQAWLGLALPLLSRNEPPPVLKAAIRLLSMIFSTGQGVPEFQRQVAIPNVPKFAAAIIALADKSDQELEIVILNNLTQLVPLYPTLHRASHAALTALSLRFLNGNAPNPTRQSLLEAASQLYAVLPLTGGKVGAANLWRKSVDETLTFGWDAFLALRTTFPHESHHPPQQSNLPTGDPQLIVPLNLDRLRCSTTVLCDLLRSTTQRPVQIPLGPLVKFAISLLSCTEDDKHAMHYDPAIRAMEVSVIPNIWKLSCEIISCLAKSVRHHLTPNLPRLVSSLTFHLEQKRTPSQRLSLLVTLQTLLTLCHPIDSPLIPTRLAKAILPILSVILATPAESHTENSAAARNKKGKKRARAFEGDEILKLSRGVVCPTLDDGKNLLAAFGVIQLLMRNHNLSPAIRSISSRVLISVLLTLPQMPPTSLSKDPTLHKLLLRLVHKISIELGSGSSSVMSKSLSLVVHATMDDEDTDSSFRDLDLLLHPRVPPLVRSLPHVESLSLFRAEEPDEEIEAREALGLVAVLPDQAPSTENTREDIIMEDETTIPLHPKINIQAPVSHIVPVPPTSWKPNPTSQPTVSTLPEESLSEHTVTAQGLSKKLLPTTETARSLTPMTPAPVPSTSQSYPGAPIGDDEDEEMPAIDLESDSDTG